MDSRAEFYKAALLPTQVGEGFDFPVFQGRLQYGNGFNLPVFRGRQQYGQGVGDVFRGIWRFFRPVVVKGAQTLLKAGSEAIKEGTTPKDLLTNVLKPTIGAVLGATADQIANRLTAPPPVPPTSNPAAELVGTQSSQQTGSGKRKRPVYKTKAKKYKTSYFPHYNF